MASTKKNIELLQRAKSLANVPWCEQYERMVSGMLYDSFVPPLQNGRLRARKIVKKFNDYLPDDCTYRDLKADRQEMLKTLLGGMGRNAFVEPPFFIDYGCNTTIGDDFYANANMCILDCGLVTIGDRVMFGPNVHIYAATHEVEVPSRREEIEYAKEVTIGNDCWIGGGTLIMPGLRIGNGVTIGAGSVVTRDVPDFTVAMGSPARFLKKVASVADVKKE